MKDLEQVLFSKLTAAQAAHDDAVRAARQEYFDKLYARFRVLESGMPEPATANQALQLPGAGTTEEAIANIEKLAAELAAKGAVDD